MELYLCYNIEQSIIESLGDGDGIRLVIFLSGCNHHCKGCHNPHSWNIKNGVKYNTKDIVDYIKNKMIKRNYSGITLSGGDPFYNEDSLYELLIELRKNIADLNIWCYTGYVYEKIKRKDILKQINVLVDGPFIETEKSIKKSFRGSSNQRILYLEDGNIVNIK